MKRKWIPGLALAASAFGLGFAVPAAFYERHDLLSDGALPTAEVDSNLVNPWGLASSPTGPFWIANEGTGTSSVVDGEGAQVLPDVAVPADHSGHPTGIVFYGGSGFLVSQGGVSGPGRFLFVTLEGRVIGWNPTVDAANAIVAVDNSATGAVYTGAALATSDGATFLYAANFASGSVDVFDESFDLVFSFTDPTVPAGYKPFGVAEIDGLVYLTFVPQDPVTGKDLPGPGNGLIDVFSPAGEWLERFATGGELNAPWGMVRAPGGFGPLSNKLLVGNFGDGRLLAYLSSGRFFREVLDENGDPIVIEGLWGLLFGNGGAGGDPHDLYFTAGIDDEEHGVFGEIEFEHH